MSNFLYKLFFYLIFVGILLFLIYGLMVLGTKTTGFVDNPERISPDIQSPAYGGQVRGFLIGERIITAYTASVDETDSTPCLGALAGIDFCNPPFDIVATNELPLRAIISIDDKEYLVADRTNSRYKNRYDILMLSKEEALAFGVQTKEVYVRGGELE